MELRVHNFPIGTSVLCLDSTFPSPWDVFSPYMHKCIVHIYSSCSDGCPDNDQFAYTCICASMGFQASTNQLTLSLCQQLDGLKLTVKKNRKRKKKAEEVAFDGEGGEIGMIAFPYSRRFLGGIVI